MARKENSMNPQSNTHQQPVLEVVIYKTLPGTAEADVLAASDAAQRWLERQPGYLHRETAQTGDGTWLDLVHWATMEQALAAANAFGHQPEAAAFEPFTDGPTVQMLHLHQVRNYLPQTA
jgi:hypothetical protein